MSTTSHTSSTSNRTLSQRSTNGVYSQDALSDEQHAPTTRESRLASTHHNQLAFFQEWEVSDYHEEPNHLNVLRRLCALCSH